MSSRTLGWNSNNDLVEDGQHEHDEELHPCVPHLVYLVKSEAKGRLLRDKDHEPQPSFDQRCRDISVSGDKLIRERGVVIGQVFQDEEMRWCVGLGKEEHQLHINVMVPKSKGKESVEQELKDSLGKALSDQKKIKQLMNHYKADQRFFMKRFRLKVEFSSVDGEMMLMSQVIRDKTLFPDIYLVSPLKSCTKGGRKLFMFSKVC